MRCPDCGKFVGLETGVDEPELEFDADSGLITGSVRVYRTCADCGQELKECNFDVDQNAGDAKVPDGWETDVEVESYEADESGGGRYAKNMIGYTASVKVVARNKAGDKRRVLWEGEISDSAPASSFDELV